MNVSDVIEPLRRRDVLGFSIVVLAALPATSGQASATSLPELPVFQPGFREFPYSSPLAGEARRGIYACAGCGTPVFSSRAKYETGTGWPSFFTHLPNTLRATGSVSVATGARNVNCTACGGRMGDLLPDGPGPRGQRFSINGAAMVFRPFSGFQQVSLT